MLALQRTNMHPHYNSSHRLRMKARAAASEPGGAAQAAPSNAGHKFTQAENYANLCSNMGCMTERPVSGYVGRWVRYKGKSQLLAEGDIIYGFRHKDGDPNVAQVWKAEEGDLTSPKLQKQRQQLPQLQKDPLQLQLDMDTLIVEVANNTPLLDPSLSAAAAPQPSPDPLVVGLAGAMRVLAVPAWGNLVVTGGLPPVPLEVEKLPEAFKTWFNRIYLRVPGHNGGKRWSVMLHYDTLTGAFLTHYHTWEAAITPAPDSLQQVFTPGAHAQTLQQAGMRGSCSPLGSISEFYSKHSGKLNGSYTQITYDANMECYISAGGSSSSSFEQLAGGPEAFEVWYDSGCYFRAPKTLDPEMIKGRDVVLEAGVVMPFIKDREDAGTGVVPDGASAALGVVRWLLCYSSRGDRRIKWVRHELVHVPHDE